VATLIVVSATGGSGTSSHPSVATAHYRVPSEAMLPTLKLGAIVTVDLKQRRPRIGDIVVFHPPAGADPPNPVCGARGEGGDRSQPCGRPISRESTQTFIKRVVAGPGDTLAIVGGYVVRNGTREHEPYIEPCGGDPECTYPKHITVPPGDYFVLGDNRGQSDDSRFWGPVAGSWIIGTVVR
jgi:signal peptidase I